MKRRISKYGMLLRAAVLCLLLVMLLPTLAFCTAGAGERDTEIVCTIYPIYDWVLNVLGDRAEDYPVRLLSDSGNDPHNYQPSVRDIAEIADSTLFLYVGGESDAWAGELADSGTRSVALIDAVDVCESDHEHDHGHEHDHDHGEYDEHFWLSLVNAKEAVEEICRVLSELYADDTEAVADFRANTDAYLARLDALDMRYREAVDVAPVQTILVADRFPFAYLVRDYGLTYHAAFPGCSAEADASFATLVELSEHLFELGLSAVLVTETGSTEIAETVIRASELEGVEILTLHSCQSVTKADRENGITYLSIMENNLSVLTRALSH